MIKRKGIIKPLFQYEQKEMSEETMRHFTALAIRDKDLPELTDEMKEDKVIHYIVTCMRGADIKVSPAVVLFISLITENFAQIQLYIFALYIIYHHNYRTCVNMESFGMRFPNGFPDKQTMQQAWRDQKVEDYDLIHNIENWKLSYDEFKQGV